MSARFLSLYDGLYSIVLLLSMNACKYLGVSTACCVDGDCGASPRLRSSSRGGDCVWERRSEERITLIANGRCPYSLP
jgi:hypothetical protein